MSGATAHRTRPGGRRAGSWLTWLGVLLLLGGLSILGWAAWQFFGTNIAAHREAQATTSQLRQEWGSAPKGRSAGAVDTVPGDAVALMRIPDLGADWEYPVLVGTTPDVLGKGVGWYTDTAAPGAVGNFAVAAHRVTHGEPFRHLLQLKAGSKVVVETRTATYTYALDTAPGQLTVDDTQGWVIDPVPGKKGQKPTKAMITLTTCADLFHSPNRSVAFGHLVSVDEKG